MDFFLLFTYRPIETRGAGGGGGGGGGAAPQICPKVDLLPIDNDSEKQKVARKT